MASPPEDFIRRQHLRGPNNRHIAERAVDQVLADSFPASDPPSWTLGVARSPLGVPAARTGSLDGTARSTIQERVNIDVINVSLRGSNRTFLRGLVSMTGTAGIAVLVPLVILLIGLSCLAGRRDDNFR